MYITCTCIYKFVALLCETVDDVIHTCSMTVLGCVTHVGTFKHISSFGERKAKNLIEEQPGRWIEHNKRQLSRIYPAGRRTDSSNYEPMPMWLCGNQVGESVVQYAALVLVPQPVTCYRFTCTCTYTCTLYVHVCGKSLGRSTGALSVCFT